VIFAFKKLNEEKNKTWVGRTTQPLVVRVGGKAAS
jgi:hypothetical protein